jgi:hypothetical protein
MATKKSGKITLRMSTNAHERVAKAAKSLGMDLNGMLNWIIYTQIPFYEDLAEALADTKTATLLGKWRQLNPGHLTGFFYEVLYSMRRLKHPTQFSDGKYYLVNDDGDDFVQVPRRLPMKRRKKDDAETAEE